MRFISVTVMQLELVDSKDPCRMFRTNQLLSVDRIFLLQPALVYRLDCVFVQTGYLTDLPIHVIAKSQQISRVVVQFLRDAVMFRLEGDILHHSCSAFRASEL